MLRGFRGLLCRCGTHDESSSVAQFDVASLVPLELFYFKTGINPLLRLPRLLKVAFIYSFHSLLQQPLIWSLLSFGSCSDQLFL